MNSTLDTPACYLLALNEQIIYHPLATSWRMDDNPLSAGPALVAAGEGSVERIVADPGTWKRIKVSYAQ